MSTVGGQGQKTVIHNIPTMKITTVKLIKKIKITTVKLDETKYLAWPQSSKWAILGKGKWEFIYGEAPALYPKDQNFPNWRAEDALVVSWLLHYVTGH